jgi:hypothetical protein
MKRITSIIGALALGTLVVAGSAFGGEAQTKKDVVVKGDKEVKIVTVIEDGKKTVKAYVNGKEVDPKTLKGDNVFYHGGEGAAKKIIVKEALGEECETACETECEVTCAVECAEACDDVSAKEIKVIESDGGLQIFVNGEAIDLNLGDIKKMLHQHAGELEGHLSMIELDDLNIEKMMKGANMLVGEFAPQGAEFLSRRNWPCNPR